MIPWRKEQLPTPVFWPGEFYGLYSPLGGKESDTNEKFSLTSLSGGFPGGSVVKNLPANAGDTGSVPGSGKFPGAGHRNPH